MAQMKATAIVQKKRCRILQSWLSWEWEVAMRIRFARDNENYKCTLGVMTHNPLSTLRFELLERTLRSLGEAFPDAERKVLLDNGSDDGSFDALISEDCPFTAGWEIIKRVGKNTTPGAGRNAMMEVLLGQWPPPVPPEIIVFSDDDMLWRPGAQKTLTKLWGHHRCPDDLAIVSGLLEPDYPWNKPIEVVEVGWPTFDDDDVAAADPSPVRVLVRESAPAAAWTFVHGGCHHGLAPHYYACKHLAEPGVEWYRSHINGRRTVFVDDFGYDTEYCRWLRDREHPLRVGQLDLAEHIGWGCSTHGNDAVNDVRAKPLDREKWRV
jgi:hypothetical protein